MTYKGSSYINILTYIVFTIFPIIMFATMLGKELEVVIYTYVHCMCTYSYENEK